MQRYENYFQHILSTDQNKASTEPGDEDDLDDINRDGLVLKKMAKQVIKICHTTTTFLINNQVPLFVRVNTFTWSQLIPNVSNRPQFCLKSSRFSGRKLFSVPKADCSAAI